MAMEEEGLDALLRPLKGADDGAGRTVVHVSRADGRVMRKAPGRLLGLLQPTIPYGLLTDVWVEVYDLEQALRIFITKEDATLRFRLRVAATARHAEKIVTALVHPEKRPTEVLLDVVREKIARLSDKSQRQGPQSLAARIATEREGWQSAVEQTIEDRLGLQAEMIFELGATLPTRPEISLSHFDVRTRDAPHRAVPVTVHVVLETTGETAHDPLPKTDRQREDRLRSILAEAYRAEVMLFDHWFDRSKVESILGRAIDAGFASTAHRSRLVQLEPVAAPFPKEEKVACSVPWKGNAGREVTFYVEAVLSVLPAGAGTFDALHLPRRADWLKEQATRALEIAMSGRDFYDLARLEQAQVADAVKAILRQAAAETGQGIDLIIAEVHLPENKWMERQYLDVTGHRYKTRNDRGFAEFDIFLELEFARIRPLVDYVRNTTGGTFGEDFNARIEASLKEMARKTAEAVMSQIEHVDYFANWERWDGVPDVRPSPSRGEPNYVHDRLVTSIQATLQSRFSARLCNVQLRRVDAEVGAIMRRIQGLEPLQVTCRVQPGGSRSQAHLIPVAVLFVPGELEPGRVPDTVRRGVEGIERSRILTTLTAATRQYLSDLEVEVIRAFSKGRSALSADGAGILALEDYVSRQMVETHGFSVRIIDFEAGASEEERAFDIESLSVFAAQTQADHIRDQIAARRAHLMLQRQHNLDLVARLSRALVDNPRLSEEDRLRYDYDRRQLEEAKRQVGEDEGHLEDRLAGAMAKPGAIQATAGVALLQAPAPEDTGRAGPPPDGPPAPDRPDRL